MITALILLALCTMAATKVTIQGAFAKKIVHNVHDALLYNGMIFLASAIIFLPGFLGSVPALLSGEYTGNFGMTALFAVMMGVLSVLFQVIYVFALSSGPVSLTVLLNNFSMLIPIILSAVVFSEPFGILRIVATGLVILSFVLNVKKEGDTKVNTRWLLFVLITFLCNAATVVVQKVYTKTQPVDISSFLFVSYFSATILAGCLLIFFRCRNIKRSFQMTPSIPLSAGAIGVILGLFQALNTHATATIDGTLLFPVYNGGVTVLLSLAGVLLFRERLSAVKWIGVGVGILAIVLMSLPG